MCFSASASFTAGAFLIPTGLYCVYSAYELKRFHYMLLSFVPFFFGVQQLIEGVVWLSLTHNWPHMLRAFSIGFVFFSHFFWPFWIPLSIYMIGYNKKSLRARFKLVLSAIGTIMGIAFFIPILMHQGEVQANMCANMIHYDTSTIVHAFFKTSIFKYLYVAIIVIPPLISKDWAVKIFGVLILISVIITYLFYTYQFNSVWCFFCAVLSIYVVFLKFTS